MLDALNARAARRREIDPAEEMLALALERFGTERQRREWLPMLASGEVRGGIALTEPDAGTDLQGIRTTARHVGDSYVINGEKTWQDGQGFYQVSSGLELGRINVAARGVGIAQGALTLVSRHSQGRKTFGKPICDHQAIQLKLADMATL